MTMNLGRTDRVIRTLVVATFLALYYFNIISGMGALVILSAVVLLFLITIFSGFCPLYAIFGLTTCPLKEAAENED